MSDFELWVSCLSLVDYYEDLGYSPYDAFNAAHFDIYGCFADPDLPL